MYQIQETYFSTGEFAKLCRTTKHTLFYYHQIGLFSPAKISESGYWLYSPLQMDQFHEIAFYRKLGISLKDIKYLFKKHSPDCFVKFTRDRVKLIEAEIQKLTQIKEAFAAKTFFIEKIKALPLNEIGIVFQKAQPLSYVINLDDPSGYSDYIAFLEALVGLDFNHYHGVIVGNESILTNTPQYGVFYTIIENNPVAGADAVKPQGDYAVAYHTGNITAISSTYEKLLAFIDANDLSPQSDFYEEYLIGPTLASQIRDYVTKISVSLKS